jgi:hypothetical protein
MSNTIDFSGNCIAIIGKWDVYLYSAGDTAIGIMLQATNRKNVIIDNLKIDGLNNGSGQLRSATPWGASIGSGNAKWISLYNVTNWTLYRIHAFNNKVNTSIVWTNNIETIDSLFYSSSLQWYSIYWTNPWSKNYLINSQVFNNNSIGISIDVSYNNVISNTLVYNNGFHGIDINGGGNNLINNIQSYNNLRYGIKMEGNTTNNIINDTRLYNNSIQWIWLTAWSSGTYYGTLKMFSNKNGGTSNLITWWWVMVPGNATDTNISWSNRSAGTLDVNWAIDYPYIANPINRSGQYFINGNNRSTTNRDNKIITGDMFVDFTYGTGLLHQANNVWYTGGGVWILSIPSYNTNNYIGQIDNILNKDPDPFTFLSTTGADVNQLYTSQSNSRLSNESSNPKSDTNVDTINEVPTRDTQPTMNT